MSSRAAKVRAVFTAIGVVLGVALLLALVILVLGGIVGYLGGTIFGGSGEPPSQGPTVEFETTVENDSVEVRHAGGDSVEAAAVAFEINGDGRGTWADHAGADSGRITDGDAVTVAGVESGDELVVRWLGDGTTRVLHQETL